jgi:hypothetical protein
MINNYSSLNFGLNTKFKNGIGEVIGSPPKHSKIVRRTSSWLMLLMVMMLTLFSGINAEAQVAVTYDFNANATGWTGNITRTSATTACGSASMRRNMYSSATTGNMVSPLVGTTLGGAITLKYNYKVANWSANTVGTSGFGSFNVQYGASATGPWTTVQTIDASNHVVSGTCALKSVTFTPPAGALYIKWDAFWAAGDYYINFDDIDISEAAALGCTGAPAPGNVTGPTSACSGSSFNLGIQNAMSGSGYSYSWQSADNAGFTTGLTTIGGNTPSVSISQTTAKYYRCTVTCSGGSSTVATALNVTINSFLDCYCSSAAGSTGDEEITNVTIGTINNTSACASLTGTQGTATGTADMYSNFKATVPQADVTRGANNNMSVGITECAGSPYGHQVDVYFDFNQNGLLSDAGEKFTIWALASSNTHTIAASIAIPDTALLGTTLMRVVCKETTIVDACTTSSWGETEDYLVNIIANTNCAGTPAPGIVMSSVASTCVGVPFTLSLQNPTTGSGITYLWESADDATFTTGLTALASTTDTQVVASQTTAKYYRCTVTCATGPASTTAIEAFVDQNLATACYCTPTTTSGCTDGDVIAKVVLNTLSNDSGTGCPSGTAGYSDYTGNPALTTELQAGSSYNCTVSAGQYSESYAAWIDYNDDGLFDNATERIGYTASPVTGSSSVGVLGSSASFPIVLSCAPPVGQHRLRVRAMYSIAGSAMTPCGNNTFGETEDYLVTITAADPCPMPKSLAITAASITASGATATWTQGCAETEWDVHVDLAGVGSPAGAASNPGLVAATATFTGLSGGTAYEYYVRSVCDSGTGLYSDWAGPFAFSTQAVPTCATALIPADNATDILLTQVLSWTAPAGANPAITGYDVYFGTAPGAALVSAAQVGTTYTPATLDINTTYYWKVVAKNAIGDAVGCMEQSFSTTSIVTYCTPTTSYGCGDGDVIAKVVLNTLSNDSGTGCPSDPVPGNQGSGLNGPGYSDYTTDPLLTTELQAGNTYNCTVSAGQYGENYAAWIDYNDNGVFDAAERIGYTNSTVTGSSSVGVLGSSASFPIVVSCSPAVGQHRLRVRAMFGLTDGSTMTPCGNNSYGEVEDYLITITAADACPKPNTLVASAVTTTSATLGWTKGCAETEWDVHVQVTGSGVPVGVPSNPGVVTTSTPGHGTLNVSGLTAGFSYEYYVRSVCDSGLGVYSSWAGPFVFINVAPGCTTLSTPADLATGVAIGNVALSWSAPSLSGTQGAATSYDVYTGSVSGALTLLGNVTVTSANFTGVTYGTYYVKIVPKNAIGSATGCLETSFTTVTDPCSGVVPAGDTFANAIDLGVISAATAVSGDNLSSNCVHDDYTTTSTPGNATARPGRDIFYKFEITDPFNTVSIGTCSTSFDSYIHFLDATGARISGDDDSCSAPNDLGSYLNAGTLAVGTYYVVVESYAAATEGAYTLNIDYALPQSEIRTEQWGQLLPTMSTQILAYIVPGYESYRFEVTRNTTQNVVVVNKYNFDLTKVPGIIYGATYGIRVGIKIGGVWKGYGTSHNVSTPALSVANVPTTTLSPEFCGATLPSLVTKIAPTLVYGATGYRFEITTGGITTVYDSSTYNFKLSQAGVTVDYGMTYAIRVAALISGVYGNYGASCNVFTPALASAVVPTTKIATTFCGSTLATLDTKIPAVVVSGASGYRFEITSGGSTTVYDSPLYLFKLADAGVAAYGTTYAIRVAALVSGVYGNYGASCNVTSPTLTISSVPTTKVLPSLCGTTLATLDTKIAASTVSGASGYRFEITTSGVTTIYDSSVYNFKLSQAGVAAYGTTYTIRVAALINGVYGNYGVSCNVSTPVLTTNTVPTTTIQPSFCGATLAALDTKINAVIVTGATMGRFEITIAGGSPVVYEVAAYNFKLSQTGVVVLYNTVYSIRVAAKVGGVWGNYGTSCDVTTPAAPITRLKVKTFDVSAYPNPYETEFYLNLETPSKEDVNIYVYDMLGKLVDSRKVNYLEVENLHIGGNFAAGIYNVIVSQANEMKSIRLIKK